MNLNNLFELTPAQVATSHMLYNGKTIKCLVAPYHTYLALEKEIPYTQTTYLFPERELSAQQLTGFISMIVAQPHQEEVRIITASQAIILDMVDDCVRILTQGGDVVACPVKTFAANIHDIRYSVLENKDHQLSAAEQTASTQRINDLITRVRAATSLTATERSALLEEAQMIGEPIIANQLVSMINRIPRQG